MPADTGAPASGTGSCPTGQVPSGLDASRGDPSREHRGWSITWDYGFYTATGPGYDASYEGEEDGWVDNGHRVTARTREDLITEIDAWFEETGK